MAKSERQFIAALHSMQNSAASVVYVVGRWTSINGLDAPPTGTDIQNHLMSLGIWLTGRKYVHYIYGPASLVTETDFISRARQLG